MLCRIAEILVEVPKAGGMAPRCGEYLCEDCKTPEIVINEADYEAYRYPGADHDMVCYMESGRLFFKSLLRFHGMVLHSSAVEYAGKAFLFSGPCGVGKSTHTRLWQQTFGSAAQVFNDDKPLLRKLDGKWYAFGAPWCGKDGINQNKKVPLAGICFLQQSKENRIRRLTPQEAVIKLLWQTRRRYFEREAMNALLSYVDSIAREIPVYELENNATESCVHLSSETMLAGAKEANL